MARAERVLIGSYDHRADARVRRSQSGGTLGATRETHHSDALPVDGEGQTTSDCKVHGAPARHDVPPHRRAAVATAAQLRVEPLLMVQTTPPGSVAALLHAPPREGQHQPASPGCDLGAPVHLIGRGPFTPVSVHIQQQRHRR